MTKSARVAVAAALAILAVTAVAEDVRVLGPENRILRFDTENGQVSPLVHLSGLAEREKIVAIATGGTPFRFLYGLTKDRLYVVDFFAGAVLPAGPRFAEPLDLSGSPAFAFHPVTGVARILRGTSAPGATPDGVTTSVGLDRFTAELVGNDSQSGEPHRLAYAAGDPNAAHGPVVTLATYHPAESQNPSLLGIDTALRSLVRIGPAGAAGLTAADDVVTTIAPLSGLAEDSPLVSLEALGDGQLILVTGSDVWSVDPSTGVCTAKPELLFPPVLDVARSQVVSLGAAKELVTEKTKISIEQRRRNADKLKVVGRIGIPQNGWSGKQVQVDFGGIVRKFDVDAFGRSGPGRESFRISGRPRQGVWKFTLSLRGDRFGRSLEIGPQDGAGELGAVVDLFVRDTSDPNGFLEAHRATLALAFRTRNGRTAVNQEAASQQEE